MGIVDMDSDDESDDEVGKGDQKAVVSKPTTAAVGIRSLDSLVSRFAGVAESDDEDNNDTMAMELLETIHPQSHTDVTMHSPPTLPQTLQIPATNDPAMSTAHQIRIQTPFRKALVPDEAPQGNAFDSDDSEDDGTPEARAEFHRKVESTFSSFIAK